MIHAVRLGAVLYCVWLLLSGHLSPLLLSLGLLSAAVAVAATVRMEIVDRETYPLRLHWSVFRYWLWLALEIVKANLQVARRILDPALPISPCVVRVPADQRSALAVATYANSITLTPGTVSMGLEDGVIEVHALTEGAARELEEGEMNRRVCAMEGPE